MYQVNSDKKLWPRSCNLGSRSMTVLMKSLQVFANRRVSSRNKMSSIAKIYIGAIVVIGAMATLVELAHWQSLDLVRFLCSLVLAIFASRLKVRLPGISGALSVLFTFILFAIGELSLPEP